MLYPVLLLRGSFRGQYGYHTSLEQWAGLIVESPSPPELEDDEDLGNLSRVLESLGLQATSFDDGRVPRLFISIEGMG